MKADNVIPFSPRKRLCEKAEAYMDSIELFHDEKEKAVDILLKVMTFAESDLKQKIVLFLGVFAKEKSVWSFYRMLTDSKEDDEIRHVTSIQLSVMFPYLKNPQPLIDRLIEDLKNEDSMLRMHAAFALGWEGNSQAAISLIELLYDPDVEVQESAVNALSNLRDDRIFNLLVDRLENASREQKQSILFNLWRFYSKQKEVISVYLRYLDHDEADLRYDALLLLGGIAAPISYLESLHKCIDDNDVRVRLLALERLFEIDNEHLEIFRNEIKGLLCDVDSAVKRAASRLLGRLEGSGCILHY
ncbi:MAG: HEAT repeat domain-containing protein [Desulfobacterales bacterium]|nr:HEAT repeat domain-containing protein [Desulfobacterales bacterium]MDD4071145.1 HEAT repeat domain-containing protein [Desulfobacterales bacterium]MDD4392581.1 HEAT repeat domain-containing protein [Desulfobacterales bacterium]